MVCIHSFLQFIFFFFLICQQIPSELHHLRLQSGVDASQVGTRWAVLVAGSSGFQNYRHQADVCHAYQTLKKGGLKDENIIVFMYDDIANNEENPMPGVIINHPQGENVYRGVPKDYVGEDVNAGNFLAVLLGNKTALTRQGSGKVVDSGPGDHIFVFYSGHGGPGILDMPAGPSLLANDLIDALKEKHAYGTYKSMVLYIEACEAGSIFEGLLPEGLNIYATTASNTIESSWATYCNGDYTASKGIHPCLGDLYSVSWMEDSDVHNLRTETVNQQYNLVKVRTAVNNTYKDGSHVMQYGDVDLSVEHLYSFIGSNPANDNRAFIGVNAISSFSRAINQRDVDLLYFWNKYLHSADGSLDQREAQRQLFDEMAYRLHIDDSVELIGNLLFGAKRGIEMLMATRSAGQPLVDDWICLKSMVRIFETHCGSLSQYGMKHMRAIANICNAGIKGEIMAKVSAQACPSIPSSRWSSLRRGFSV